jgi:hypothetical protein
MSQSTWVALILAGAFLIFVTARGELPAYLAVLGV